MVAVVVVALDRPRAGGEGRNQDSHAAEPSAAAAAASTAAVSGAKADMAAVSATTAARFNNLSMLLVEPAAATDVGVDGFVTPFAAAAAESALAVDAAATVGMAPSCEAGRDLGLSGPALLMLLLRLLRVLLLLLR